MEPEDGVLIEEPSIGAFQLRVRSGATAIFADEPVSAGGPSSGAPARDSRRRCRPRTTGSSCSSLSPRSRCFLVAAFQGGGTVSSPAGDDHRIFVKTGQRGCPRGICSHALLSAAITLTQRV
jgi:hypothetical protein